MQNTGYEAKRKDNANVPLRSQYNLIWDPLSPLYS